MDKLAFAQEPKRYGILQRLRALAGDRRGVGAVEFALIAPLLLGLYITAFEITMGLSVGKRVTRSANTISDLVTQQTSVSPNFLLTMTNVAKSMFAPYSAKDITLKITGVTIDAAGKPTVLWSWGYWNSAAQDAPYKIGDPFNVPSEMRVASSFLVHSEVSVSHELLMFMPGIMPQSVREITIRREYFYHQRLGDNIPCALC